MSAPAWSPEAQAVVVRRAKQEVRALGRGVVPPELRAAIASKIAGELWPEVTWPNSLDDLDSVDMPGARGVQVSAWALERAPQGFAWEGVWRQVLAVVDVTADGEPVSRLVWTRPQRTLKRKRRRAR